jgi:hypothetical protein
MATWSVSHSPKLLNWGVAWLLLLLLSKKADGGEKGGYGSELEGGVCTGPWVSAGRWRFPPASSDKMASIVVTLHFTCGS